MRTQTFSFSVGFSLIIAIVAPLAGCAPSDGRSSASLEDEIGHPSLGGSNAVNGANFGEVEIWKTENATCEVKGNTSNWQAAYCMWLHQSEHFDSSEVQECFAMLNKRPAVPQKLCERNLYFKREICKSLAVDGYFHRSVEECVASDASVPVAVREGLE